MFTKPFDIALKKWNNKDCQYIEFCNFETLQKLLIERFVNGKRRLELFNSLGVVVAYHVGFWAVLAAHAVVENLVLQKQVQLCFAERPALATSCAFQLDSVTKRLRLLWSFLSMNSSFMLFTSCSFFPAVIRPIVTRQKFSY
jgi:hypothetical protein